MAESPSDSSKNLSPTFILMLTVAFLFLVFQKTLPLLLLVGVGSGAWQIGQRWQKRQQRQQATLDEVFYRLIQQHQGRITTLDLTLNAKLPPQQVQQYLDQRAAEFSAQFDVTDQGGIVYYFQTVKNLTLSAERLEIESKKDDVSLFPLHPTSPSEEKTVFPLEFNQSELAQRLNVHPSTIRNWKHKPQFQHWSSQKDPDAIPWQYSLETKRFYPVIPSDKMEE